MRLIIIICCALTLVGCSQFSTSFENVQTDEYRLLDFVYEPAEAAPGDTVHVKAIFAGKKISVADIDWKISYNVVYNRYGTADTAIDLISLPLPVETKFTDQTTCMEFSVVIPEDIMYTSKGIPDNWTSLIPADYQSSIPDEYKKLTKKQMLDTMGLLMNLDPSVLNILAAASPELKASVPLMCQLLTVQMRLFADIRGDYRIKSDYSVRFNSNFSSVPALAVPVNNNPVIDSLGIYKVPGTIDEYNPAENRHTFYRLDVPAGQEKTILLEKDYSYFVEVFTNTPDTTRTLLDITNGTSQVETYYAQWFYQMDSTEMDGVSYNDYMNINTDKLQDVIVPPADEKIKKFTIWAQVRDELTNEVLRPVGSSLIEGRGVFEYTKGYLDQENRK